MKIERIEVKNLFDMYSYPIEFKIDKNISIIHAPNGYGKTTVFTLIRDIFDLYLVGIAEVPFSSFRIELSDKTVIIVEKKMIENNTDQSISVSIHKENDCIASFEINGYNDFAFWTRHYSLKNAIIRYDTTQDGANDNNNELSANINSVTKWMNGIRNSINIHFIAADRLYEISGSKDNEQFYLIDTLINGERSGSKLARRKSISTKEFLEKIRIDADNIIGEILQVRLQYSVESEKRDREFPDNLVKFVQFPEGKTVFSDDDIARKLELLREKRINLEKAGLLLTGNESLAPTKSINDTMKKFYTLYIEDAFEKLKVYDDLKQKLEMFMDIINNKTAFSNKRMRIDGEFGIIFEPIKSISGKKKSIPLQSLSSGEKNIFIMFYELIFNSDKKSVFLIDEPEISWHVAWQMEFLDILNKICEINGTQAIIATHSPDIVNGHDDLLISLDLEETLHE